MEQYGLRNGCLASLDEEDYLYDRTEDVEEEEEEEIKIEEED